VCKFLAEFVRGTFDEKVQVIGHQDRSKDAGEGNLESAPYPGGDIFPHKAALAGGGMCDQVK
jgi:hypothetical protein